MTAFFAALFALCFGLAIAGAVGVWWLSTAAYDFEPPESEDEWPN